MDIRNWLKNKKIAVLYGGISKEREISIKSGSAVLNTLKENGFNAKGIDVKNDFITSISSISKFDFAFIALHGSFGEDGTIQAVLETTGIPYSGSGVLASALAMNKIFTKKILSYHNLPTPEWIVLDVNQYHKKLNFITEIILKKFNFPFVVKPSDQGSAIGVNIVETRDQIKKSLNIASKLSQKIIIEEYIQGKELTVGILQEQVLPVIEIIPVHRKFYDFKAKYSKSGSKHIIPAIIPLKVQKKVQSIAKQAFDALSCRAVARVDFRLSKNNKPYVLEINTIPGLTETSLLPDVARFAGINFNELILKIIEFSLDN